MAHETLEKLQARLAKDYRAWHFWLTKPDGAGVRTLMATRIAHITDDLVRAGLCRTLPVGSKYAEGLEAQLAEQTLREAALLAPQEALQ